MADVEVWLWSAAAFLALSPPGAETIMGGLRLETGLRLEAGLIGMLLLAAGAGVSLRSPRSHGARCFLGRSSTWRAVLFEGDVGGLLDTSHLTSACCAACCAANSSRCGVLDRLLRPEDTTGRALLTDSRQIRDQRLPREADFVSPDARASLDEAIELP